MIHKNNFLTCSPGAPQGDISRKPGLIVSAHRKRWLDSTLCTGEESRQSIVLKQHVYWRECRLITRYASDDFRSSLSIRYISYEKVSVSSQDINL